MKTPSRHSLGQRLVSGRRERRSVAGALTDKRFLTLAAVAATIFALVSFAGAADRSSRSNWWSSWWAHRVASSTPSTGTTTAPATPTAPTVVADTQAPSVPQNQRISGATQTSLTMTWSASTDDTKVAGYEVWLDAAKVATTTETTYTYASLACGKTYTVGLVAYDAAGNRSNRAEASGPGATSACAATPAPAPAPAPSTPAPAPAPAPSTPAANVAQLSGTVTSSQVAQAAKSVASPATVRGPFTVNGNLTVPAGVRVEKATVTGHLTLGTGSAFDGGSARGFDVVGNIDNWQITNSTFDGGGVDNQNVIWDSGGTPDNWTIKGNLFKNYYKDDGSHSEAIFVGYSTNGLIEGNTFQNNGNTGHIFFSYWGTTANPSSSHPKNMCVRGNTFGATHGAYFAIDIRAEIPPSTGIDIEPAPSNKITSSVGLSASGAIVRSC